MQMMGGGNGLMVQNQNMTPQGTLDLPRNQVYNMNMRQ
jgi:hypothetical protein